MGLRMKDTLDTTSYWHLTQDTARYPELTEDAETDTLIIGGGITGVTCAFNLGRLGADAMLIEASSLCGGTTGNTTGKATIQHGIIYSKLIKKMGNEAASLYYGAQMQALEFIKAFGKSRPDDFGYAENEAFIYASSDAERRLIEDEYNAARELKIDAELIEKPAFPPESRCMMGYKGQAVIHPVRYVEMLAKRAMDYGVKIFEHTKAIKIADGDIIAVKCENGAIIRAKHLIIATQFPIYEGMGAFFTRLYPRRSYAIAVKTKANWPDGSYINMGTPARSLRTHVENGERVLIVVGDGHVTARSGNMQEHFDELMRFAAAASGFDNLIAKWSAQDYKTPDDLPFIGRLTKKSNIFVACGFAKWGITSGTLAGMMIPEIILNGKSEFDELLAPSRLNLKASAPTFLTEVGQQVKELVHSKLEETDSIMDLERGQARIIPYNGQRAGAFMDDDGQLTIVDITCTHLGCELNWNNAERSWDCPCHGGRFNFDGRLLEGPPSNPLKILHQDKPAT
jgi:glycine/D-amino acid oxidase-like deaminating enzyme/nitrite reductase/ring-hydroxylating ferredoxin subunit